MFYPCVVVASKTGYNDMALSQLTEYDTLFICLPAYLTTSEPSTANRQRLEKETPTGTALSQQPEIRVAKTFIPSIPASILRNLSVSICEPHCC
ncbi:hypothetical protein B0T17DRAFT_59131 [Bombardia bombarda]|uniref:Uncharacterized protein n=1 Tax=Bombardia bombarda TaxID=252184 RepID=A0AA39XKR6_9PEZI|nr:hypothetical protein B0T17DRAFT_59131 [Bombardia bombarda]